MKRLIPIPAFATALFLLLLAFSTDLRACNRSEIGLDSVVAGPGYFDIYITMHVGAGVTGQSKGAGGDSQTFAFAFYGGSSLSYVSYTPSITSDTTAATYPGVDAGTAFGSRFCIGYIYPGVSYACIGSTASCGNEHTDTKQVFFRVNEMPDSCRLFGIEGAGNPYAGCFPDADMLLDFTTLPVIWSAFNARADENGVDLDWTTASEKNNDRFLVQRSTDGVAYENIAEVDAAGTNARNQKYAYHDAHPSPGTNFYKIVQVDHDGASSESSVKQVEYRAPEGLAWTAVGPNPVADMLRLEFRSESNLDLTLRVLDLQGRLMVQREVEALTGVNALDLDMQSFANGFYYIELNGAGVRIDKKVMKL